VKLYEDDILIAESADVAELQRAIGERSGDSGGLAWLAAFAGQRDIRLTLQRGADRRIYRLES